MSEKLFRKKSLDKIASPESLTDYIRVTNPGVWLVLTAIVLLLIGACIWAIFGRIDTSVPGIMQVSGGEAAIELYAEDAEKVRIGDSVKADGIEGIVSAMGDPDGDGRIELIVATEAEDGMYHVKIVTESVSAWSFIAN